MKKSLMATTALVAASVAVSGAHAQDEMMAEPISITVGGVSYWGVHAASGDYFDAASNENTEGLGIAYDGEVRFKGKTVLDNGLEVGVSFELEGEDQHSGSSKTETRSVPTFDEDGMQVMDENGDPVLEEVTYVTSTSDSDDTIDEAHAYVSGSFGEIRIGVEDPAAYNMATAAPYATYLYAANSPFWSGSISTNGVGWHTTFIGGGTDSTSLSYFTPVVNGFQLGLSYAPEWEAKPGGGSSITANEEGKEAWSIAARYDGSFSEQNSVTVAVGMLSKGDDPNAADSEDETSWNAGLVLSRGGISVGGSYASVDDGSDDDNVTYDIGASYGDGPWTVSITWLHNEDEDDSADNDLYRLLGNYSLGAGVNVAGGLGIDKPDNGNDVTYLGAAIAIGF